VDTLFISDIHLSEERPDKIELLRNLLRGPARRAAALYILGDLFENFWLGNDDKTPPCPEIIKELQHLVDSGVPLYLVRGNRELVLDEGIEKLTGCTLLPDRSVVEVDGNKVLITHGDVLCTKDVMYQVYRRFMELPPVTGLFLCLPYGIREFLVRGLRPLMKKSSRNKPTTITDVDQTAVVDTMQVNGAAEIIHGHTHRPGVHEFHLGEIPARRIGLGDWYSEDSVLVCRDGEKKLMRVQEYIDSCN